MDVLAEALLKQISTRKIPEVGNPWGPWFPYTCGVTPEGFRKWATNADGELDSTLRGIAIGPMLRAFCDDCFPAYRERAKRHGECIESVFPSTRGQEVV